jgi:hypothetical protein
MFVCKLAHFSRYVNPLRGSSVIKGAERTFFGGRKRLELLHSPLKREVAPIRSKRISFSGIYKYIGTQSDAMSQKIVAIGLLH